MKRFWAIGVAMLAGFGAFAQDDAEPAVETASATEEGVIVVCPVTGVIEPGVKVLVERAIREAEEKNAKAIIFRIDTPGGRVDSAVEIAALIDETDIPTIAFIEKMGAISAGALISYACDDLVMTPGSNIGAAAPVTLSTEGTVPLGEKEKSYVRAKMRALAEANGHNPAIAEAMVDSDIELRSYRDEFGKTVVYSVKAPDEADAPEPEGGRSAPPDPLREIVETLTGQSLEKPEEDEDEPSEPYTQNAEEPGDVVFADGSTLVLARGKLLTLTPDEALEFGVIDAIVKTLDEAVSHFMLGGGTYHTIEPNWAEKTYRFLTNPTIAGLLLMMGLGGLYFEVRTPGFGLPGMIAVVALGLLFGAHYVLGFTETIDIILILLGIALIAAEIFILPGLGIAGVLGFACLMVGTYLALVNFTIPEYSWEFERIESVAHSLLVATVTSAILILATWRLLPRTPIYRSIMLAGSMDSATGWVSPKDGDDAESLAVGSRGVATSMLRPAGRARFGTKTLDVVTRGAFIDKGVAVELIQIDGNRYVVEAVPEETD
jgi:membrane-bound serine protease (ClpP class)